MLINTFEVMLICGRPYVASKVDGFKWKVRAGADIRQVIAYCPRGLQTRNNSLQL
jgi:hypothetical protein